MTTEQPAETEHLAQFSLAFTKALQSSHSLIRQDLAEHLSKPSSTSSRSLGFFIGDRNADSRENGRYLFHFGSGNGYLSLAIISRDGQNGAVILINKGPNPWTYQGTPPQYNFSKQTLKQMADQQQWL